MKEQIRLRNEIEALLFASGDKLSYDELAEILETEEEQIKTAVEELADSLKDTAVHLVIYDNYIQMATRPEYYDVISRLSEIKFPKLLTEAQLETLSVIAYRQPVTKAEIEKMRGVRSDKVIKNLTDRNLIEEAGKLNQPGNPILYRTTSEFLKVFGFNSLEDLPGLGFVKEEELKNL